MTTTLTPSLQGGLQHVSVPEESAITIAVPLPVPASTLAKCMCTVIDLDDPNTCGIAPYIEMDAMPWLVTDPAPGYVAFPLQPPASSLRWGPPLFYERRRAVFQWKSTDLVAGVTQLAITLWSVAGMPVAPDACPPEVPMPGVAFPVRFVTADTTLAPADGFIVINALVNGVVITLPPAAGSPGHVYVVTMQNYPATGNHVITVAPPDTLYSQANGGTSIVPNTQPLAFISDGVSGWYCVSYGASSPQ